MPRPGPRRHCLNCSCATRTSARIRTLSSPASSVRLVALDPLTVAGFLIPEIDLERHPSINRHSVACAVQPNAALEPYRSRKAPFLSSWPNYTEDARRLILESLARWWCQCVSSCSFARLTAAVSATKSSLVPMASSQRSTARLSLLWTRWTRRDGGSSLSKRVVHVQRLKPRDRAP